MNRPNQAHLATPTRVGAAAAGRAKGSDRSAENPEKDGGRRARGRRKSASVRQQQDPQTRQRVIQAAIQCILEEGFYRASSNAIAEKAGLTWGVIQYYFGTRESLMLAVVEEGTHRLIDDLAGADIKGESLQERIAEYISIVERYYADPEYLAFIQALVNLSHDPRTSAETLDTMMRCTNTIDEEHNRLTTKLFQGTTLRRREWRGFIFHLVRGLALSEVMLTTLPYDTSSQTRDFAVYRRLLTDALTLLVDKEAGSDRVVGDRKRRAEGSRTG
jgi:AcrR family transcriptional regulator